MRGLVLAAGRGARMGPSTADRPKCLVEVAGRTLLDRQVRAMREAGVDEVGVVVGWRAEAFAPTGLTTFRNEHWDSTTQVGSLAAAAPWLLDGPVLVGYGDIVFDTSVARRLAACDAPLAVAYDPDWEALWRLRFDDPLADAETFRLDGDHLVEIGGTPASAAEVDGQFLGLVRWTPPAWRTVARMRAADPEVRDLDTTGLLSLLVRTGTVPVAAVAVDGPWFEFDHPSDLDAGGDALARLDALAGPDTRAGLDARLAS